MSGSVTAPIHCRSLRETTVEGSLPSPVTQHHFWMVPSGEHSCFIYKVVISQIISPWGIVNMVLVLKWNNPKLPGCSLNLMIVYLEMAGERDMEQNRVMKPQAKDSVALNWESQEGFSTEMPCLS